MTTTRTCPTCGGTEDRFTEPRPACRDPYHDTWTINVGEFLVYSFVGFFIFGVVILLVAAL